MLINLSFAHQQESVMLKYLAAIVALIIPSALYGQTVIYYEDGTAYTLKDNEHVYVSKARKMYQKKDYDNGNVYFTHKKPNDQVDPEESATDGLEPGSPAWCDAYTPYLLGYTWDDQIYERACDQG